MAQDVKEEQDTDDQTKKGLLLCPALLLACIMHAPQVFLDSVLHFPVVLLLNLERHVLYSTKYIDLPGS